MLGFRLFSCMPEGALCCGGLLVLLARVDDVHDLAVNIDDDAKAHHAQPGDPLVGVALP